MPNTPAPGPPGGGGPKTRVAPYFLHAAKAACCAPRGSSLGSRPSSALAGQWFWPPVIAFPTPHFLGFSRHNSPCAPRRARPTPCDCFWASLVVQLVKNPPATRETWVTSLAWEGPLEKRMTTHSSILTWRIPWTVQSMGSERVGHG